MVFWNLSVDLERERKRPIELGKRYAAQAQGTEFAFESSLLPEPREGLDLHLQLDGRNEEIGNVSLLGSWRRPVWEGTAFTTLEAQIHLPAGGGLEGSLDLDDGLGEGLQATLRGDPQHTMFLEARSRNLPLSLLHHWASRTSLTDQLSGVRGHSDRRSQRDPRFPSTEFEGHFGCGGQCRRLAVEASLIFPAQSPTVRYRWTRAN